MEPMKFYTKDGDQEEFKREKYLCEKDALYLPRGSGCQEIRMYERCMKSKGFKPIPDSGSAWACP